MAFILGVSHRLGRHGEVRDLAAKGQQFKMACLSLPAAIIKYQNADHLGRAIVALPEQIPF